MSVPTFDVSGNPDPNGVYTRTGARLSTEALNTLALARTRTPAESEYVVPDTPAERYDICACGHARFMHEQWSGISASEFGTACEKTYATIDVVDRLVKPVDVRCSGHPASVNDWPWWFEYAGRPWGVMDDRSEEHPKAGWSIIADNGDEVAKLYPTLADLSEGAPAAIDAWLTERQGR